MSYCCSYRRSCVQNSCLSSSSETTGWTFSTLHELYHQLILLFKLLLHIQPDRNKIASFNLCAHNFFLNNLRLLKFYLLSTAAQPDVLQDGAHDIDIDIDIEGGNQEGVETELASEASSPGAPSVDGSYSEKSSEDGSYSVESNAQRRALYSLSLPTFNLVKFFQATLALGAVLASALVVTTVVQRWNNAAATASLAASFAKAPKSKAPKSKSSKAPSAQPSVSNYPSFSPSTSSAPTTCTKKQDGVECGIGSECCSPVCDQACQGLSGLPLNLCLAARPETCGKCVDDGNICSDSEQCCGSDHFCSLGLTCTDQCTTRGNLCSNDDQCCDGNTCDGATGGSLFEYCDGCIANGNLCTSASQCCETTTCKKSDNGLLTPRECGSCIPQGKSCLLASGECCDGLSCKGNFFNKKCKA